MLREQHRARQMWPCPRIVCVLTGDKRHKQIMNETITSCINVTQGTDERQRSRASTGYPVWTGSQGPGALLKEAHVS